MGAAAATDATEIEAQRGDSPCCEGVANGEDDVVLHVAAVQWVRVADDGAGIACTLFDAGKMKDALKEQFAGGKDDFAHHRSIYPIFQP